MTSHHSRDIGEMTSHGPNWLGTMNLQSGGGSTPFLKLAVWCLTGFIVSLAIAWCAARVYFSGQAPLGLLSIGVGMALGGIITAIGATLRVKSLRRAMVVAVVFAMVTVLSQHAWLYHGFRQQWQEARSKSPEVALFRPEAPWSPREYFAHELTWQRAALWCLDAVLITVSAAATTSIMIEKLRQYSPSGQP